MSVQYRDTEHGRFAFEMRQGQGDPLVLIHSVGTSKRLFEEVVPCIPQDRTVLVPDILGHGESSNPSWQYSIPDHAAAIVSLTEHLGISRFQLAGTSLGALIAIEIAASHPSTVTNLVLNGCPGWHLESQRMARLKNNSARLLDEDGLPRRVERFGSVRDRGPDFVRCVNDDLQSAGRWLMSSMWAISAYDIMPRLPKIIAPTLVLMGELDFHLPTVYQLSDAIPRAMLEIVPDAGHLTPYDDPAAVATAITEFYRKESS